jgi:hypothetical protein
VLPVGSDLNAKRSRKALALHIALEDNLDISGILIRQGALTDSSMLHYSVFTGQTVQAYLLL